MNTPHRILAVLLLAAGLAAATAGGWQATYYGNPDFTGVQVARSDPAIDFAWGAAAPLAGIAADTYSVRWRALVTAPSGGTWTFTATADDGVRVWVGGRRIIDRWIDQGASAVSGQAALSAGQAVEVVMEYYQNSGAAVARLEWEGPGQIRQVIPATATTPAGGDDLPGGWSGGDIGSVTVASTSVEANGTWTVTSSSTDIWGAADSCGFVRQAVSGDVRITARVATVGNSSGWAKAGVMVRESAAAGSRHAATLVTPGNGVAFQRRLVTGGTTDHTAGAMALAPYWVRMERIGNTLVSSCSANGTAWSEIRRETLSMGAATLVGLAVTSHNPGAVCAATFTNVEIVAGSAANQPPVITSAPPASAERGVPFAYQVQASDPDRTAGGLGYALTGAPNGMTVSGSGLVAWTPAVGIASAGPVTVTVRDALGAVATQAFTLTVDNANPMILVPNLDGFITAIAKQGSTAVLDFRTIDVHGPDQLVVHWSASPPAVDQTAPNPTELSPGEWRTTIAVPSGATQLAVRVTGSDLGVSLDSSTLLWQVQAADTTPPTLTMALDRSSVAASGALTAGIAITASEAVSGLSASDLTVTGGTLVGLTAISSTRYSAQVDVSGPLTVVVPSGSCQDAAGNAQKVAATLSCAIPAIRSNLGAYGTYRPSPGTTGVLPGVARTDFNSAATTGTVTLATANTTYANLNFYGDVILAAGNLTFTNCFFSGGTGHPPSQRGCVAATGNANHNGAVFTDCTFRARDPSYYRDGIIGNSFKLYRCQISNTNDGVGAYSAPSGAGNCDVEVYGSYIHDLVFWEQDPAHSDGTHNDCIQFQGGSRFIATGNNLVCHLTADPRSTGPTHKGIHGGSGIILNENTHLASGVVIANNWFAGGYAQLQLNVGTRFPSLAATLGRNLYDLNDIYENKPSDSDKRWICLVPGTGTINATGLYDAQFFLQTGALLTPGRTTGIRSIP